MNDFYWVRRLLRDALVQARPVPPNKCSMNEWKGPWKCEKCGKSGSDYWRDIVNIRGHHVLNENENCDGRIVPYDRRSPDRELADWKAERDEYIGRNLAHRKDITELVASEQTLKAEREKLIRVLVNAAVPLEALLASVKWELASAVVEEIAKTVKEIRAALAEVKG